MLLLLTNERKLYYNCVMAVFPEKIWVCPECHYRTLRRFDMERHLYGKHRMCRKDARDISYRAEYLANPVVYQWNPQYDPEPDEELH